MNNKEAQQKAPIRKEWRKPVFMTISSEELKKHIKAAARSGACPFWTK